MMIFARKVASEADDGFLFQVYASTREQEIAEWGWTKQQQEEFYRCNTPVKSVLMKGIIHTWNGT